MEWEDPVVPEVEESKAIVALLISSQGSQDGGGEYWERRWPGSLQNRHSGREIHPQGLCGCRDPEGPRNQISHLPVYINKRGHSAVTPRCSILNLSADSLVCENENKLRTWPVRPIIVCLPDFTSMHQYYLS